MSAATDPASALAACARLRGERDAALAKVARVDVVCRNPSGQREWHNQGRSGWTDVVDVNDLRAALNPEPTP